MVQNVQIDKDALGKPSRNSSCLPTALKALQLRLLHLQKKPGAEVSYWTSKPVGDQPSQHKAYGHLDDCCLQPRQA